MLFSTPSWPKPPDRADIEYSTQWISKANRFSEFALTVFWPWPAPGTPNRFVHVDRDGERCEAYQEFQWRLEDLADAPSRYADEVDRISKK